MQHEKQTRRGKGRTLALRLAAFAVLASACVAGDLEDESFDPERTSSATPLPLAPPASQVPPPRRADPELAQIESYVAPGAALLRDAERNPTAVREAGATFAARLTDADAIILLELLVRVDDVLSGASELEDFELSAASLELLRRYRDIPYLSLFEAPPSPSTAPGVRAQSIGGLAAPLVELPFTPECSGSCTTQTMFALLKSVGAELVLKDGISKFAEGIPGGKEVLKLAKKCVIEKSCTKEEFEAAAAELALTAGLTLLAPELALAVKLYELGKLAYQVAEYHLSNMRACEVHQQSGSCCNAPRAVCGGACCEGYETCCDGQCVEASSGCQPRGIASVPRSTPEPASAGDACCDVDTLLFSPCDSPDGPPSYDVDCAAAASVEAPPGCRPNPLNDTLFCCPARMGKRC